MIRAAIIQGGVVTRVANLDPESEWQPDAGFEAVPCGPEVGPGWTYDGEDFIAPPQPDPPRRLIDKSVVQERVNAIGKLDDVMALLNSQAIYFARWFVPGWTEVYFDDADLLAILAAVGCTPAQIETITAP